MKRQNVSARYKLPCLRRLCSSVKVLALAIAIALVLKCEAGLRIRIRINTLNLRRARIHWIHNPFLDLAKETKNPFLDSESGLGFFPKKCALSQLLHVKENNGLIYARDGLSDWANFLNHVNWTDNSTEYKSGQTIKIFAPDNKISAQPGVCSLLFLLLCGRTERNVSGGGGNIL